MKHLKHHNRAFTLIEVIAGLAVTVVVIGGIFGVAGAALDLASSSNRLRLDEMRHDQLCRFLRSSLLQLPPESKVALNNGVTLTVLDAGGIFQWPGSASQGGRTDLSFENGAFEMGNYLGDAEISSLRMMEDLTYLVFEVYDPTSRQWLGDVPAHAPIRPALVKMRYMCVTDSMERVEVFWVPRFAKVNFTPQETSQNNEPPVE